jgi:NhaP-type Na+/H+ or K+/H+ antiporter
MGYCRANRTIADPGHGHLRDDPGALEARVSSPRLRLPSYAVWETAVLVLDVLAFLLIGLELGPALAAAPRAELGQWLSVAGAVLATVIVMRLLWIVGSALWTRARLERQRTKLTVDGPSPDWRTGFLVGWAGTRCIVTP